MATILQSSVRRFGSLTADVRLHRESYLDPISLAGAYQGLKAAKDILTTAFDAKVDSEAKSKILEAQTKLGDVQDALFVLRERLSEL